MAIQLVPSLLKNTWLVTILSVMGNLRDMKVCDVTKKLIYSRYLFMLEKGIIYLFNGTWDIFA